MPDAHTPNDTLTSPRPAIANPLAILHAVVDILYADGPDTPWEVDTIEHVARVLIDAQLTPVHPPAPTIPRPKRLPTVLELAEREPHLHQPAPLLRVLLQHVYPFLAYGDERPAIDTPTWLLELLDDACLSLPYRPDASQKSADAND